jgi:hypothetical protein
VGGVCSKGMDNILNDLLDDTVCPGGEEALVNEELF